jgi:tetratricopeptide (TPR) repeat protein
MSEGLVPVHNDDPMPMVPWRDPHTVSPEDLSAFIQKLEAACLERPSSADLRTCLGMAYAVNYDINKSMDALEKATELEPENFWAQVKLAELHYRLRTLVVAERETLRAVNLARNGWQLAIARKQLNTIRQLRHLGTRDVTWDKPLMAPTLVVSGMIALAFVVMMWR